jgi:hypothetical protein
MANEDDEISIALENTLLKSPIVSGRNEIPNATVTQEEGNYNIFSRK